MTRLPSVLCAFALCSTLAAMQLRERELLSPIVNRPFHVQVVPFNATGYEEQGIGQPADMETDDDGCRHHSGLSEYHYYVATCPYTFFSAVTAEWDPRTPRFSTTLSPEFKRWVRSKDGLHSEWVIERNQIYKREQAFTRRQGKELPPLDQWMIPQRSIPVERKYQLAIRCYQQRQARAAFMGRLCLTGSWALRVDLNRPFFDQDLGAGVGEVNDRIKRAMPSGFDPEAVGEDYDIDVWREAYGRVFLSTSLSDEAYFVAGTTYFGMVLRQGDLDVAMGVLEKLDDRFKQQNGPIAIKLRGLVRERQLVLRDYLAFTRQAVGYFIQALQGEEIARPRIPVIMMAVAEGLRRSGRHEDSYDWYLTLANLDETNKRLRESIHAEGGAPRMESGFAVQLGWQADRYLRHLREDKGVVAGENPSGPHAGLLNAIRYGELGTPDFESETWRPVSDGDFAEARDQLDRIGKMLIEHQFRLGSWPERLGELWLSGVLPDWNAVNRFRCPATGAPYAYEQPSAAIGAPIVLVAMTKPVATNQGPRYGAYLLDNSLVWTSRALAAGAVFRGED